MRLFLSSQDFGKYPQVASELAGNNKKAAFIKNAQDDSPAAERNFSLPEKQRMFEAVGFDFEEIDLRKYFGKQVELRDKLAGFGSVWCAGGNTFILRRAMKASGLDEILRQLLHEDKIVYGGWSAGACIAAPTLHGVENGDRPEPDAVPVNYPITETIWEGLGLVEFMVVPHYKSDWFGTEAGLMMQYCIDHKLRYKPLEDGQVVVVNGDKVEVLS